MKTASRILILTVSLTFLAGITAHAQSRGGERGGGNITDTTHDLSKEQLLSLLGDDAWRLKKDYIEKQVLLMKIQANQEPYQIVQDDDAKELLKEIVGVTDVAQSDFLDKLSSVNVDIDSDFCQLQEMKNAGEVYVDGEGLPIVCFSSELLIKQKVTISSLVGLFWHELGHVHEVKSGKTYLHIRLRSFKDVMENFSIKVDTTSELYNLTEFDNPAFGNRFFKVPEEAEDFSRICVFLTKNHKAYYNPAINQYRIDDFYMAYHQKGTVAYWSKDKNTWLLKEEYHRLISISCMKPMF